MSDSESSATTPEAIIDGDEIFLDTSVVLNYAHIEVEGNKGSHEVLRCDSFDKTIGSTVRSELESRLDVRKDVYRDFSKFLKENRGSKGADLHIVYKYDSKSRDEIRDLDLTQNDIDHIRRLQHHLADKCDRPQYTLRKYNRFIKRRIRDCMNEHRAFPNAGNSELARSIGKRIENHSDGKVLSQAVKWKRIRVNNEGLEVEAVISDDKTLSS